MTKLLSEGLLYHINNDLPIRESVYRPGSLMFFNMIMEAKQAYRQNLFEADEDDQLVKANRTETLAGLMRDHNMQLIQYPVNPIMESVRSHLKNTKKIIREGKASGDDKEVFIKTGEDHFAHSLNYARIARLILHGEGLTTIVGALPMVAAVKVGANSKSNTKPDPYARYR